MPTEDKCGTFARQNTTIENEWTTQDEPHKYNAE